MTYLFIGIDEISKERKIAKIKQENIKDKEVSFDYELIYADDVDKVRLTDSLNRLPLQAQKRITVIKRIEKLSVSNREVLNSFLKNQPRHSLLILDAGISDAKDNKFIMEISRYTRIFNFMKARSMSVFDLADAIANNNAASALRILSKLVAKGEKPHRLLGGLTWKWSRMRRALSPGEFNLGLKLFLQADTNIKLGRLKPNFALELLVVKLCDLRHA